MEEARALMYAANTVADKLAMSNVSTASGLTMEPFVLRDAVVLLLSSLTHADIGNEKPR